LFVSKLKKFFYEKDLEYKVDQKEQLIVKKFTRDMTLDLRREKRILEVSEEMHEESIYSNAESIVNQGIDLRENKLDQEVSSICPSNDNKFKQIKKILTFIEYLNNYKLYSDIVFLSSTLKNLGEEIKEIKRLKKYYDLNVEELKQLDSAVIQKDYNKFRRIVNIDEF
jgi:hypothetical protein